MRCSTPSARTAAVGVQRIAGRWISPFGGETRERRPGSPLPLTPEGLAAWESYDERLSPLDTCEPAQIPGLYYAPAYIHDIRIGDQEAVLYHEPFDITRTVPLSSEPQPAEQTGALGLVSGRIEGEQLVIESSGYPASKWGIAFASSSIGNGGDVPSSVEKTVTERFSVSDDGATLKIDYTITDPAYLTEPYSSFVEYKRIADDAPVYGFDCEPGG